VSDVPPRPAPEVTAHAAPFWAAARDGRLVIQHCPACGQHQHFPRPWCTNCLSEGVEFVEVSGAGTIYTFTVIRRSPTPAFAARVPYVLAFVDLDEGVRLVTNIVDCDPESVRIGQRVRARFEAIDDEHTVVLFAPAASDDGG
jgi:uncharacterized OB-fold protein